MKEQHHQPLGVALSGGGVRAALFALGSLLYLVDSRNCERVAEITSVSGGSITSGFIAQRCDLSTVNVNEFDAHAATLIHAITSGLVPMRGVLGAYGLLCAITASITWGSWPLDFPRYFDALLLVAVGVLPFFRGVLLSYLLQRRLFGAAGVPRTLGSIESTVAHYFCATDLNASMPIFVTNVGARLYSPMWGVATSPAAGNIRVADAVRASAAFPLGIPPKRLNVRSFGLTLAPAQRLHNVRRLSSSQLPATTAQPSVLFLSDGGVWNNLGTDWFDASAGRLFATSSDNRKPTLHRLIVDATAPSVTRPHLHLFWVPLLADILCLFRAALVSYSSTVTARRDGHRAATAALAVTDRSTVISAATMIEPLPAPSGVWQLAWRGRADHWSGRWTLGGMFICLLRRRLPRTVPVVRHGARLHDYTSQVPTTLSRLSPEVALLLLVQGYASTAKALASNTSDADLALPGIDRFTRLLGLKTYTVADRVIFVGSKREFLEHQAAIKAALADDDNELVEQSCALVRANVEATMEVAEAGPGDVAGTSFLNGAMGDDAELGIAMAALGTGNYSLALSIYNRVLHGAIITNESIQAHDVAGWGLALTYDENPLNRVLLSRLKLTVAESRMSRSAAYATQGAASLWLDLGRGWARVNDAAQAVRCFRQALMLDRELVLPRLRALDGSEDLELVASNSIFEALMVDVRLPPS